MVKVITKEIEIQVRIKAILGDDGELKLTASFSAPYGEGENERRATAVIDDGFSGASIDAITEALEAALSEIESQGVQAAQNAAAEAAIIATKRGEL